MNKIKERLLLERNELQHSLLCLENSDDRLFCNANNNLRLWKTWVARIRVIDQKIKEYDEMVKEQRQKDILAGLCGEMGKWSDE